MKKLSIILLSSLAGFVTLNSCKKKFELPPRTDILVDGYITIDSIYKKYVDYYQNSFPAATTLFKFSTDINLKCTVTADETSGNIYKTVYVQDSMGNGLQIKLINAGGLYVGDQIRINLNGVVLDDYGKTVQLDSIDISKKVVKISSGNIVLPIKLSVNQLMLTAAGSLLKYQSRLVMLDSMEFDAGSKNVTYADPVGKYSLDRFITNSSGTLVDIRTSGYSKFAGYLTPCGKGSITAILTQYGSTPQLTIRDVKEVKMTGGGCPLTMKTFDDQSITSGGWTAYTVTNTTMPTPVNWTIGSYSGQLYANITNYFSSSNHACETWLISPSLDLSTASNPRFSFKSAYNYTGPAIQVLVSTNYNSGDPNTATWVALSPALSPGGWAWTSSGTVSLSSYLSPNTRVAFKYTGTNTTGSTWEIDDIAVFGD